MKNDTTSQTGGSRQARSARRKTKYVLIGIGVLIVVLVVAIAMVPVWVSSSSGRNFIVNKVNESTSGQLAIGELSMGWFSGIDAGDISFSDAAAGVKVDVKRVSTEPHYFALLAGDVKLGKTVIEQPVIELAAGAAGGEALPAPAKTEKAAAAGLPVKMLDLTVKDGSVKVTPAKAGMQAVQISNIGAKVDIRPGGQKSDFNLAMNVQSDGAMSEVKASGSATGITEKGWRLTDTTGDLDVQVSELDLGALQGFLAAAGVKLEAAGKLSTNITASLDNGEVKVLDINVNGKNLAVGGEALKGDRLVTSKLDIAAKVNTQAEMLNIQEAVVSTDWLDVTATGSLPTKALSAEDLLSPASGYKLEGKLSCNLAQVLSQMPHMLGMKPGMQMTDGRLTASVSTAVSDAKRVATVEATVENVKGTMEGKAIAISAPIKLDGRVISDGKKMSLENGVFVASFANIECQGPFESVDYRAKVDLSKLQAEASQFVDMGGYGLAGRGEETGNISIKDGVIGMKGTGSIADLVITAKGERAAEPMLKSSWTMKYDTAGKVVTVDTMTVDGSFGKVLVEKARMAFGDSPKSELPIAAQLDLRKLLPFAMLLGGLPKEMDLGGTLNAQLTANQDGPVWHVVTKDLKLENLAMVYPGHPAVTQKELSASFDGRFNTAEHTYSVRKLDVVGTGLANISAKFEKTTSVTTSNLQGQMKAEYDLAAVSTLAAPFVPKGLMVKGVRKQDATFSSTWPTAEPEKMMDNMTAKTSFGFDELKYMGMVFGKTEMDINVDKGLLNIPAFSAPLNGGRLNFGGTADFGKKPTFLVLSKPMAILDTINITDEMVRYDKVRRILELVPVFGGASSISGTASLKCQEMKIPLADAGTEAVVVTGVFDVNDLRINGGLVSILGQLIGRDIASMTIRPANFVVRDGIFRYTDGMTMMMAGEQIDFTGQVGLNDTIDMVVSVPVKGQRFQLPLKGAASKPELDRSKLLEQNLQPLIQRGVEELLKRR